jgi:hypothetical protein
MDKGEKDDLNAIRRRRLVELLKGYKTQQQFADAAGWAGGTYVSLVISGHKNLGETLARRAEKKLKLPAGWFDREGDTGPAYVWPFTFDLERIQRLNPQDLAMVDGAVRGLLATIEQRDAPRKKPGGGGPGGSGGGGLGGGTGSVTGLPGGTTKHAPLTLVHLTPEEQLVADELALQRAKNPRAGRRRTELQPVDADKLPKNRDLFEK